MAANTSADSTVAAEDPRIPDLEPLVIHNVTFNGKKLGDGSYGTVEEASVPGLQCAAKRIHDLYLEIGSPEDIAHMRTTFVNECRLMSSLRHPHLVQFMGVCYPPGCKLPVLVMERLHTSLHERLESKEILPDNSKLSILIDVSRGVAYLHGHSPPIVHRDLTARNMLLTKSGVAKISDFGMARIVNIRPGQKVGTMTKGPGNAFYMPPEANEDHAKYSTPIDIFSFGNAALFTGTQKFPDPKNATYIDPKKRKLVARSEIERREESFSLLSEKIGKRHPFTILIKECLRDIPENRPSAVQLLERLEGILTDTEVDGEDSLDLKLEGGKVKNKQATPDVERVEAKPLGGYTRYCQYEFKVLLVGSLVGCSCFFDRFSFGIFDDGWVVNLEEAYTKSYKLNDDIVSTTLCDVAGQAEFESWRLTNLRVSDAVIIFYDITRYGTFTDAVERYKQIQSLTAEDGYPAEFTYMLMGTKCDLEDQRKVTRAEAMEFAKTHNMMFIETSAKESINVEKAIIDLTTELYLKKKPIKTRNKKSKCLIS